jgi:hypothetical protein
MKKSAIVVSILLVTSLFLFSTEPLYAMGEGPGAPKVESVTKAKPMTGSKKPRKMKKTKNTKNTKASSGRCKNPDDLDASGKRCGKRAASAKPGGN